MSELVFEKPNQNLVRIDFEIIINSTAEKLWDILWNPEKVNDWLKIFGDTTKLIGNLEEGGNVQFLNDEHGGMNTIVQSKIVNKLVIFRHIGMIKDGDIFIDEVTKLWENAMEGYVITQLDNQCKLSVFIDTTEEYKEHFDELFNKALAFIKDKCEN